MFWQARTIICRDSALVAYCSIRTLISGDLPSGAAEKQFNHDGEMDIMRTRGASGTRIP